jgi:hypothetical protein
MTYEDVKSAVLSLEQNEQKRLVVEVLLKIMPAICADETCLDTIRKFINEEAVKKYREQHMDGI